MTSKQHQHWIDRGKPWRLATPIAEMKAALLSFGAPADTIGTLGDDRHLDAEPPEDHTPYSETGWPVPTPNDVVTAIDYQGPNWNRWAEHWIAMADAGHAPWIKYMNYEGVHYSWEPHAARRSSTDWKGHAHMSIRSDWCNRSTGLTPAQLVGADVTPGPPPPPGPTPGPTPTEKLMQQWNPLKTGDKGARVRDAQALLNAHGAALAPDGDFGPKTLAAVQGFQVNHHVANSVTSAGQGDGIVGVNTLAALLDLA